MSIPVELEALAASIEKYAFGYLLTVSDDLTSHAVAVNPAWSGSRLTMDVGRRTATNAAARSKLAMVFPPVEVGGYSLIVDGSADVDGQTVAFTPSKAVLHRPAASDTPGTAGACGNDCVPVALQA